ncbi:hypothetical protein ACFXOD_14025 [Streptomyces sp. NPDC059161]|uniref:hypothetical protein n=1 Tax=Streptomyces sp. NPDC059161 TaxID=3346749 RepID=UPI003693C395
MRTALKGVSLLALLCLILVAATEGITLAARHFGHQFFYGVNPTVSAAIVAAMSTTIVSIGSILLNRSIDRRRLIENEIREKKIPIYSTLVSGLFEVLHPSDESTREAAAGEVFRTITPQMITWASDDVLIAWSHFRRKFESLPEDDRVFLLEGVLSAIRKDFGHSGIKVREGDLLGLFITDIDQALARRRQSIGRQNRAMPPSGGAPSTSE